MTHQLDLNRMGLVLLNEDEMMDVVGGGFWSFLATIGLSVLCAGILMATFGIAGTAYVGGAGLAILSGSAAGVIESGNLIIQINNPLNNLRI